jgi:hypothetical protein
MANDPSRFDGDEPRDDEDELPAGHDGDEGDGDEDQDDEAAHEGEGGGRGVPVALAATDEPVTLRVALVEDERTPEGMVCMGTFRGERLIARCVLPPEAYEEIEEHHVFDVPVPVILVAQEAPPGLQCRLFAMITLPESMTDGEEDEDDESEPWAASVPSSRYEEAVAESEAEADDEDDEDDAEGEEDGPNLVPLPLGNIVRFDRDRVHPDSLPREAMDILQKVIDGQTSEVVDRALADLLDL